MVATRQLCWISWSRPDWGALQTRCTQDMIDKSQSRFEILGFNPKAVANKDISEYGKVRGGARLKRPFPQLLEELSSEGVRRGPFEVSNER